MPFRQAERRVPVAHIALRCMVRHAGLVDQSAALCRAISEGSEVPVLYDTLRRIRPTPQQIGLSRSDRATNVQGAFRVPDDRRANLTGRRVVLVDDVLTSGATVDTCARALLRAGAARVDVLVFARVVAPARATI